MLGKGEKMFAKIVEKVKNPVVIKVLSSVVGAVAGLVVAVLVTGTEDVASDDVPFEVDENA